MNTMNFGTKVTLFFNLNKLLLLQMQLTLYASSRILYIYIRFQFIKNNPLLP